MLSLAVADNGASGHKTQGFYDGASLATEYFYDANGNVVADSNKGIDSITYNSINLVDSVAFSDGRWIKFFYTPDAIKIRQVSYDGAPGALDTTHYCMVATFIDTIMDHNRYVYDNAALDYISNEYGYAKFLVDSFEYRFIVEDQVNSTRVIFGDDGTGIAEQLQYAEQYPFGLEIEGRSDVLNPGAGHDYKFQGQESVDFNGLGWDQFKWRMHDAALGRFTTIDPLSEEFTHNSTYAFSENKVVAHVELEGLETMSIQIEARVTVGFGTGSVSAGVIIGTSQENNNISMASNISGSFGVAVGLSGTAAVTVSISSADIEGHQGQGLNFGGGMIAGFGTGFEVNATNLEGDFAVTGTFGVGVGMHLYADNSFTEISNLTTILPDGWQEMSPEQIRSAIFESDGFQAVLNAATDFNLQTPVLELVDAFSKLMGKDPGGQDVPGDNGGE